MVLSGHHYPLGHYSPNQVLVTKTLEQATMEMEEEKEMHAMTVYRDGWVEGRKRDRAGEDALVEAESQRYGSLRRRGGGQGRVS